MRTTRRISLTFEGSAFLEDCQRILNEVANAEASVSLGGIKASGHVRITAPAGFGRRHVAPLIAPFVAANKDVSISLELSDRLADIVNDGFDLAIRIGQLDDSSLVGVTLAENRRVIVASPAYLSARGTPSSPDDLTSHNCLTFGSYGNQPRGWLLQVDGQAGGDARHWEHRVQRRRGPARLGPRRPRTRLALDVGGGGRSQGGPAADRAGWLRGAGQCHPCGFPQRRHLPLRVRMFIDHLKNTLGDPAYWRGLNENKSGPQAAFTGFRADGAAS